jgi:hypothetical protein
MLSQSPGTSWSIARASIARYFVIDPAPRRSTLPRRSRNDRFSPIRVTAGRTLRII